MCRRDRSHEGSSDQSDESDIICMDDVLTNTTVPKAIQTVGEYRYAPDRLTIHWPKNGGSLIYSQPYGGVSVELAEWSIATVFELLSVDVFMQLMICVMLERPVAVLCTSPGPRSAVILALIAVLRPWRYAHTVRFFLFQLVATTTSFPGSQSLCVAADGVHRSSPQHSFQGRF